MEPNGAPRDGFTIGSDLGEDGSDGPAPAFVFALGSIAPRFPSIGVEKEFSQARTRVNTVGQTDQGALHTVLSQRENRYLVRQLCWVLTIEGLETYILVPRSTEDFDLLVEALRFSPRPTDLDVVIGRRGPIAPPTACNGMQIPIVIVDQIYSFDRADLIQALPKPDGITDEQFAAAAGELLDRIMQIADNAGAIDEHRALNYLAVRYPVIYQHTAQAFDNDRSLSGVEVRTSRLSGARRIVDVVFSFTDRATDVKEQYFTRVDVTEEFPFLVTKLSPFFER